MKRPDIGDTFTNGIDNITDDGIGQIKVHDGHINIGPVTEDALGVKVTATLIKHGRAELHTDAVKPPVEETGSLKDSFTRETHVRIGKTFRAVINEVTDDGRGLIYTRTGYIDLGPVTEDAEGEYVHALKLPGNAARVKSAKVQPDNYIDKLENTFNFGFSLDFGDASAELHKRDHKTVGIIGNYGSISKVRAGTPEHDGVDVSELEPGDVFSAEVQRISRAGNGIIETVRGHEMNIGQIPQHKVGDDVNIYYEGNPAHGKYLPREQTFTAEIKRRSDSGNGLLGENTADLNIGPVTEDAIGERVTIQKVKQAFGECVTVGARADGYERWIVDTLFDGEVPPGAEITVTLNRIDEHGNGIAEIGDDTINVGPVQPDAVKSSDNGVRVKILETGFAKCMDIVVRDTPYTLPETATAAYAEDGEVFHDVIDVITDDGYGAVITGHNQYVNIGPVEDGTVGERVHVEMFAPRTGRCLTNSVRGNGYDEWLKNDPEAQNTHLEIPGFTVATAENTGDEAGSADQPESGTSARTQEDSTVDVERGETSTGPGEPHGDSGEEGRAASTIQVNKNSIEDSSHREPAANIDELRAKAVQDSVENVPTTTTTTSSPSSSKQEYTRSAAIREYVKARADGYCEACGNPAPFNNIDGDPYLHAHHIHELSDSGSDTIDTVAAICPNCHYRIHHGEDGHEYNQELLEKIQSIENIK